MQIVVDTSAIIAVLTSEPERALLVETTRGAELVAPSSVHWEIGNALGAMLEQGRIKLPQARRALEAYREIPIRMVDVDLEAALEQAFLHKIYAYDAYLLVCALRQRCPLLSLDRGLLRAAVAAGIQIIEVKK